jgi:hypothetical protein
MADAILTFDLEGRQVTVRVRPQVTNLLLGDEAPSTTTVDLHDEPFRG